MIKKKKNTKHNMTIATIFANTFLKKLFINNHFSICRNIRWFCLTICSAHVFQDGRLACHTDTTPLAKSCLKTGIWQPFVCPSAYLKTLPNCTNGKCLLRCWRGCIMMCSWALGHGVAPCGGVFLHQGGVAIADWLLMCVSLKPSLLRNTFKIPCKQQATCHAC